MDDPRVSEFMDRINNHAAHSLGGFAAWLAIEDGVPTGVNICKELFDLRISKRVSLEEIQMANITPVVMANTIMMSMNAELRGNTTQGGTHG